MNNIDMLKLYTPNPTADFVKQLEKEQEALFQYVQTPEDRMKPLTERMDSMKSELEIHTKELQKLQYENTRLNAQIEVLNITNDKQLTEIKNKQESITQLKITNQKLQRIVDGNKWSSLKSLMIGIIGTIIADFTIRFIIDVITNL